MDFIDPNNIGIIEPTGLMWEPYGDTPYFELIAIYSDKALALRAEGAKSFHLKEMNSLSETRAGVLGLRQAGLPIDVTLAVDSYGKTIHDADLLASLIVLQGLSIRSFGFRSVDGTDSIIELLEALIPHAKIPITLTLDSSVETLSDDELSKLVLTVLKMGVMKIYLTNYVINRQAILIRAVESGFDETSRDDVELEILDEIAACSADTFYLRDDMVHSEPIDCHYNMGDHIISAEDEGSEILVFDIPTAEDAYRFGLHCHLARVPIAIRSDNEEALETALILYNGIAIIDCLSEVPEDIKEVLASGYNALIR